MSAQCLNNIHPKSLRMNAHFFNQLHPFIMNAKSFFLLAAFVCAAFLPASFAQIGIKAGVNLASTSQNESDGDYSDYTNNSVVGFVGGLTFDLGLSDFFTIQPEILFIQKGGKSTYKLDDNNKVENRYYYNNIDIPVLAKLKFGNEDGGLGFYFLAGPYIGLALGGKVATTTTLLGNSTDREDDFVFDNSSAGERAKRLDYGVSFGGGVKISSIILDLRYNVGLNNVNDGDALNSNDEKPFRRHRGLSLTAGYEF